MSRGHGPVPQRRPGYAAIVSVSTLMVLTSNVEAAIPNLAESAPDDRQARYKRVPRRTMKQHLWKQIRGQEARWTVRWGSRSVPLSHSVFKFGTADVETTPVELAWKMEQDPTMSIDAAHSSDAAPYAR